MRHLCLSLQVNHSTHVLINHEWFLKNDNNIIFFLLKIWPPFFKLKNGASIRPNVSLFVCVSVHLCMEIFLKSKQSKSLILFSQSVSLTNYIRGSVRPPACLLQLASWEVLVTIQTSTNVGVYRRVFYNYPGPKSEQCHTQTF